jgi:hypothetical protein
MATDNQNQGRDDKFDQETSKTGGQQQPESGQEGRIGGQQGQESELGRQGEESAEDVEISIADRTGGQQPAGGGFVGSQGEETGEYLQEGETEQAGFAEQGRGAPEEGSDIERGGERTSNRDSDIEGSSEDR